MAIDRKFWDGSRWNSHEAFDTVTHAHVCCYDPVDGHDTCDIMIVGMSDGRWYVEDNWGDYPKGIEGVWNPFNPSDAGPGFYPNKEAAMKHAISVVAKVSGQSDAEVSRMNGGD
jgi:hypothetical protein